MGKIVSEQEKSSRYELLDIGRAVTLISMIVFHGSWDLVYIFGKNWMWYRSYMSYLWQQSICWTFIFLSGFCWSFGRNHYKRGTIVFLGGCVISIVTYLFMYEDRVIFGVLTFIGSAMILLQLLQTPLKKLNKYMGFAFSCLCFLFFKNVNERVLGFSGIVQLRLPGSLYKNMVTAYLGFPQPGFFSTDYFSLLPWFFLFLAGYYFYGIMKRNQWMKYLHCDHFKGLQWIGKHSLIIYMIHQPVIYGVFILLHQLKIWI